MGRAAGHTAAKFASGRLLQTLDAADIHTQSIDEMIDDMSDRRNAVSGIVLKVLQVHNPLQIVFQSV